MSTDPRDIKYKHILKFRDKDKADVKVLGELVTLITDCHRKVAKELIIYEVFKRNEKYSYLNYLDCESFVLKLHGDSPKLTDFILNLEKAKHEVGQIFLDSSGTIGLVGPLSNDDKNVIGLGLRCFVYSPTRDNSTTVLGLY